MPFFEGLGEWRSRMEKYWKVNPQPPGVEIEAGSEWSDVVECGLSPFDFLVSRRVIDVLERERIPIHRKTQMPIHKIKSKRLREVEAPGYYVVEAAPGLAVDWQAMGVLTDERGRPQIDAVQAMKLPPLVFDWGTWSGFDLFSLTNWASPMILYCTSRFKDLAEKERWTNLEFEFKGS